MKKIVSLLFFIVLSQNPSIAQYVYGDENMNSSEFTSTVQPPIENEAPVFSNYTVKTETSSVLEYDSGTRIKVPSNAFIDKNGNLVKGKVDIKFREFTNPIDIYLSGIPMTVEQGNQKEFFQSAGMVEIRASQNGEEVFPNPDGEMIKIEITSSQLGNNFQLYNLDESTGEWIEESKDEILWSSNNLDDDPNNNTLTNNNQFNPRINYVPPPRKPEINFSISITKLYRRKSPFKVLAYANLLQFKIEAHTTYPRKNKKIEKERNYNYIHKPSYEFHKYKKMTWFYDGKNKAAADDFLSKVRNSYQYYSRNGNKDTLAKYTIEDIIITPNLQQDNYNIEFKCKGITKTLQAYPYFGTSNPISIQKKNERFYKYYKEHYQKRCVEWKRLEAIHKEKYAEYEIQLASYDSAYAIYKEQYQEYRRLQLQGFLSADQKQKGYTRRQIPAFTFGILNIDKIMKSLDEEILVEFKSEEKDKVNYSKVIVFDETNNALLTYYPDEKVRFDRSAKNSLLVILDNQLVAMIEPKVFKNKIDNSRRSQKRKSFQITPIEKDVLDKKMISDVLASN